MTTIGTTIEAKDAQLGVIYKNARGMVATLISGLWFRAPSGAKFELEPDTELTVDEEAEPEEVEPTEPHSAQASSSPEWTPEIGVWVIRATEPDSPMCVIRSSLDHPGIAARHPDGLITSGLFASELRPAPRRYAASSAEVPAVPEPAAPTVPEPQAATDTPAEGKAARPRCACSGCGKEVSLVEGGVARKHWIGPRTEANLCPGSGRAPKKAEAEVVEVQGDPKPQRWPPEVGDSVTTVDTGGDVAIVTAINLDNPSGAYTLRWEGTGETFMGWPLTELRPVAVLAPEAEPVVAAPSPGDTFQVQEGAESPTLEAVCAAMSGLEDDQEEPSEGVQRLFSDDQGPSEGEPLAFSVPPEREETIADFIEGIPRLGGGADSSIYYIGPSDTDMKFAVIPDGTVWSASLEMGPSVPALGEDEEGWFDCDTFSPDDGAEIIAETASGARRMARVRVEHGTTFIDDGHLRGVKVVRWKPWKKAQPDQAAEIARLYAIAEVANADARECAETKKTLRLALGTLTEIGVEVGEALVTTASTQERIAEPKTQAQIVAQVKRLVAENASLRAERQRHEVSERAQREQADELHAQDETIGNLRARLVAAEEKAARYHKAARRAVRATLAALGDEP